MVLGLALAVGLAGAGPASAGVVNVTFSLTGQLSTVIGSLGPAGSGSATITFTSPSFSQTTIVPGPIHVAAFQFTHVINPPALGGGLQGLVVLQGASLVGTLTGGGGFAINGPLHVAAGQIHCLLGTANCAGIGLPFSLPVPLTSAPLGPINLGGGAFGGNTLTPTASFVASGAAGAFLGFPISLSLTGVEVSRQHVAEPGSLLLLGSGLAGLSLFGARRFRR